MRAVSMSAWTNPNRHLITRLLQELTNGEGSGLGYSLALEANRITPLGGCAEAKRRLCAGHCFAEGRGGVGVEMSAVEASRSPA
jgi:hypothetical protein